MSRLETTILYILTRARQRGKENLSKFELFKFLYLLENESYRYTGKSFFSGHVNFFRDKNGPISHDAYTALSNMDGKYIKIEEKQKSDYPHARHCISLNKEIKKFDLGESERYFINSVIESYIDLPIKELKKIVYSTEPMQEIIKEERKNKGLVLKGERMDFNSIPLDADIVDLVAA